MEGNINVNRTFDNGQERSVKINKDTKSNKDPAEGDLLKIGPDASGPMYVYFLC